MPVTNVDKITKGYTAIVVTNTSSKPMYLAKDRHVASSDLGNLFTVMHSISPEHMAGLNNRAKGEWARYKKWL